MTSRGVGAVLGGSYLKYVPFILVRTREVLNGMVLLVNTEWRRDNGTHNGDVDGVDCIVENGQQTRSA